MQTETRSPNAFEPTVVDTKSVSIDRYFTKQGENVLDAVEWELRDAVISGPSGEVIFEQKGVEFPKSWSQLATNVVTEKYFRGKLGTPERETSLKQVIERVVGTISMWSRQQNYFNEETQAVFSDELTHILLHQKASFNSPVWFNVGITENPQVSACFIQSVDDSMESIMELAKSEVMLFKGGSGTGTNLSALRGSNESLSGGGRSSGPLSFMKGYDSFAGVIKSGGKCLAPGQLVLTATGPKTVESLVGSSFVALSFDPPAGRYKAKQANAWASGVKQIVRIVTDKGVFETSSDHPFRLSTGEARRARDLKPGNSLFSCAVDTHDGYMRVGLKDGAKGRDFMHRMVARDVLGADVDGCVVHHRDGDRLNNIEANLKVMTQREHAVYHGKAAAVDGEHVFVRQTFPKPGSANGMHRDSTFWKSEAASNYRVSQRKILTESGRALDMQQRAADQKMLNTAFRVLNAGYRIDSFEEYVKGRKKAVGRIPSIAALKRKIDNRFGSYTKFVREVDAHNHRVEVVEVLGESAVYSVEVECPTLDDKSSSSGHNYVLWSGDLRSGSGVAVFNTRRAAKMVMLDVDHPDILKFIGCKAEEERKAHALIESGWDGTWNATGGAYDSVQYQNANHSVRVSDEFMEAVEADKSWPTINRLDGETAEFHSAKDILRAIAENAHFCGDPGMQYDTTINEWHTCPNDGRINASNPCVTGDTLVATVHGLRRIRDLVGETPIIATMSGDRRATRVWSTGVKPVYELRTRSGLVLKLTADHRVFTKNRGYVKAADLSKDDVVVLQGGGFGRDSIPTKLAEAIGYAVGDGCIGEQTRGNPVLTLVGGEQDRPVLQSFVEWVNENGESQDARGVRDVSVREGQTGPRFSSSKPNVVEAFAKFSVLTEGSALKDFTDDVFCLDRTAQAAVLRGLFTADGTVTTSPGKSTYVGLDSTSLALLRRVKTMLLSFGVKAKIYESRRLVDKAVMPDGKGGTKEYNVQQMHALRVTKASRLVFEQAIGFCSESPKVQRLREINETVSTYSDPMIDTVESLIPCGEERVFDLTEPETNHFSANGLVVHNCSEYMHLDNTACNLASINLRKFERSPNGIGWFDVEGFQHTVKMMITSQDIMVAPAHYPTEAIGAGARKYRQLGLGYANLGGLLMSRGMPYDSWEGRRTAAYITDLMQASAYQTSSELAQAVGTFDGYEANAEPMLAVIDKHMLADRNLSEFETRSTMQNHKTWSDLADASCDAWNYCRDNGGMHGYRNSQVSVLAPTGTIAFMMDCDTTGIEPEISLVKYKSLAGGGSLKLVNRVVEDALNNLGYSDDQAAAVREYITENGRVEGCPIVRANDISVFDCSFRAPGGTRVLAPHAHVKMMAAVQPFLSGAISKTVNVDNDTTVEEIEALYVDAWKRGIKALAIYRDGCKKTQPLSTSEIQAKEDPKTDVVPQRRRMNDERDAKCHKFTIGGHEGYLHVGLYEDGSVGELFIRMAKEGSTISGMMDAFATSISIGLQYGVPLVTFVEKFKHTRFEPSGFTQRKDIRMAQSIIDYIFRYLEICFIGVPAEVPVDEVSTDTVSLELATKNSAGVFVNQTDAPMCTTCGNITVRNGSCHKCMVCGTSNGCS